MQLTIHIDNQEIQDIIDTLKEQGMDVTSAEVQSHIEDYIQGAIHDSRHERMDCVVDSLLDLQDWFLYTDRMKNKEQLEQPINVYIKSQNPSNEDQYIKDLMERRRKAFYEESKLDRSFKSSHTDCMQNKEPKISGSIFKGVQAHVGNHKYEHGYPEVVELAFEGYNSTNFIVIDMETARELQKQLEFIL